MLARHYARSAFSGVSLIALLAFAPPALAATFDVATEEELAFAIGKANESSQPSYTINVIANITLTRPLPPLGLRDAAGQPLTTSPLVINGNGNTVSGGGTQRIFFANAGEIAINDVTLADGHAKGGDGGTGYWGESGGGGLGAGGALFVRGKDAGLGTAPLVKISGVVFAGNAAVGGNGGADTRANGGGGGTGAGGGLGGDGAPGSPFGAGGGGAFTGQNGTHLGVGGGHHGGPRGQPGGDLSGGGQNAGGGFGGGGGGGNTGITGGSGGFGGGGGGGGIGAGTPWDPVGSGGAGGFGGGGGAGPGGGGRGGFAGGNGGSGTDRSAGGGGGALGGSLFVADGGMLLIVNGSMSGGSVTAGAAGGVAGGVGTQPSAGQAAGTGMFLQGSGSLYFEADAGKTVSISDAISDETGFLRANPGYSPDPDFYSGRWHLHKSGAGTLILSGINSYSGSTDIDEGTVAINDASALGTGLVNLGGGALLTTANVSLDKRINIWADLSGTIAAAPGTTLDLTGQFYVGANATAVFGSSTASGIVLVDSDLELGGAMSLVIAGGTLRAGNDAVARMTEAATSTTVTAGATLDFNGQAVAGSGPTIGNLRGAGTVTNSTGITVASGSFGGAITGAASLTKVGSGALTLSGASSYSGGTTLSQGALGLGHSDALGTGALVAAWHDHRHPQRRRHLQRAHHRPGADDQCRR